ncbi:unnamed protein product [Arctogadus glacialis]
MKREWPKKNLAQSCPPPRPASQRQVPPNPTSSSRTSQHPASFSLHLPAKHSIGRTRPAAGGGRPDGGTLDGGDV